MSKIKKNPWAINDAFDPMFTDEVEIVSGDAKQTLRCVVFADATGEVLSPDMIETDRMDISISVRHDDWWFLEKVHVGDIVNRIVNGKLVKYAVTDVVDDFVYGKVIRARSMTSG